MENISVIDIEPFNQMDLKEVAYIVLQVYNTSENHINYSGYIFNKELTRNQLADLMGTATLNKDKLNKYASEKELKKIIAEHNKTRDKNNPFKNAENKLLELIEPNQMKKNQQQAFINVPIIKNKFQDYIIIFEAENQKQYLKLPDGTFKEFSENEKYDIFSSYYKTLKPITKEILPLTKLLKIEPIKLIECNPNVIKFEDGVYNITTNTKYENITLNNIPITHLDYNFNYNPTNTDMEYTKKILKHMFKDYKLLINRLKDIIFNKKILKGFTIIYGISGTGKTVFLSNILSRLLNNKPVTSSNFNRTLERGDLITNGLSLSIDEIQNTMLNSTFFNEFTSGFGKVPISRKYKNSVLITPSHVFLSGENVPYLHDETAGTYTRMFILETNKQFMDLSEELIDYMDTNNFINTIFHLIKKCYVLNPEVKIQVITADTYEDYKRDLTAVLNRYIYSNPHEIDNLGYGKNNITCDVIKSNGNKELDISNYGYRLDLEAIKELVIYLQENNMIDTYVNVYNGKFSRKLTMEILPNIINEFDNKHEKKLRIKNKTTTIKLDITPTPEALRILQSKGVDISKYELQNNINKENG